MGGEGDTLATAEVALRDAVRLVLGDSWQAGPGAPANMKTLRERQEVEARRRPGGFASRDLLEYTELYHLETLVLRRWQQFQPVFGDKRQTEVLLALLGKYRNSIAHSRPLLRFEQELVAGASGLLRQQLAVYVSEQTASNMFYSRIDRCVDQFGNKGDPTAWSMSHGSTLMRLEVGAVVEFTCEGTDPAGDPPEWSLSSDPNCMYYPFIVMARGRRVRMRFRIEREHVGENLHIYVGVRNAGDFYLAHYADAFEVFRYAVNPPPRERIERSP